MIPNPAALQPTPAAAPAAIQKPNDGDGPKNIARFTVMTRASTKLKANTRPIERRLSSWSVNPLSEIHWRPKTDGEYQIPPITNATTVAVKMDSHHSPVIIAGIPYRPFGQTSGPDTNR